MYKKVKNFFLSIFSQVKGWRGNIIRLTSEWKKGLSIFFLFALFSLRLPAQLHTESIMMMGRNALYYDDYVLAIQYFNKVIDYRPYLYEPYFYRGLAKFYLGDYSGAETDCTASIEREPYFDRLYQLRGICRIKLGDYEAAAQDYRSAIKHDPYDQNSWYNMALCQVQTKNYKQANNDLDEMLKKFPKYTKAYNIKAQIALAEKDTLKADSLLSKSIEINSYDASSWEMYASLLLARGMYEQAESPLSRAIELSPQSSGNYVNRALSRYHKDNLRGAMEDYDMAVEKDPESFLAHYNRGLLCAQLGEDNKAVRDFSFVLQQEPNDNLARFNRALLLEKTGDYKTAIHDYTLVIKEYPNFLVGYESRARCKRKIGDYRGANADERKVLIARLDQTYGGKRPTKVRKRKDKDIKDYSKIVVEDENDSTRFYSNEMRGTVQNNKVETTPLPPFFFTYFEKNTEGMASKTYYSVNLDSINRTSLPLKEIKISCSENHPEENILTRLFEHIDAANASSHALAFVKATELGMVKNYDDAIKTATEAIKKRPDFALAYFLRSYLALQRAEVTANEHKDKAVEIEIGINKSLDDINRAIKLLPSFAVLYYNKACLLQMQNKHDEAIKLYSKAIETDPGFAEAYYNRALAYILQEKTAEAMKDMSRAGELGLYKAYSIIKKYSYAPTKKNKDGQ